MIFCDYSEVSDIMHHQHQLQKWPKLDLQLAEVKRKPPIMFQCFSVNKHSTATLQCHKNLTTFSCKYLHVCVPLLHINIYMYMYPITDISDESYFENNTKHVKGWCKKRWPSTTVINANLCPFFAVTNPPLFLFSVHNKPMSLKNQLKHICLGDTVTNEPWHAYTINVTALQR